jgi:hypothetical protein
MIMFTIAGGILLAVATLAALPLLLNGLVIACLWIGRHWSGICGLIFWLWIIHGIVAR